MNANNGAPPCRLNVGKDDPDITFKTAPLGFSGITVGANGDQYLETLGLGTSTDFEVDVQDYAAYSKLKVELIGLEL
jgi:hypothetical protein